MIPKVYFHLHNFFFLYFVICKDYTRNYAYILLLLFYLFLYTMFISYLILTQWIFNPWLHKLDLEQKKNKCHLCHCHRCQLSTLTFSWITESKALNARPCSYIQFPYKVLFNNISAPDWIYWCWGFIITKVSNEDLYWN